jgi:hypothetical protein
MKMSPATSFVAEGPVDLGQFSLRRLSETLRRPETWPPEFEWNYTRADTCAMGLAYRLGMIEEPHVRAAMKAFGLRLFDAFMMFCSGYGCARESEVTPGMVADRIDACLGRSA